MSPVTSFGLGLITFSMFAYGVLGREELDPRVYRDLRNAAFARAGVKPWEQCHQGAFSSNCKILDHIVPLCLHALDEPNAISNLQVQQCDQWNGHRCLAGDAFEKDIDEIAACNDVKAGRTTVPAAVRQFRGWER